MSLHVPYKVYVYLETFLAGNLKIDSVMFQYHVDADWLFDMEDYNEFMCEEDYEVDEAGEPQGWTRSISQCA